MDKEELVRKCAHEIKLYSTQVIGLQSIQNALKIRREATTMINFRDALNHYVRLYEATDNTEAIKQAACIEEHLFRGIKDSIIHIENFLRIRTEKLLYNKSFQRKSGLQKNKLRKVIHKLKNMNYDLRMESDPYCIRDIADKMNKLTEMTKEVNSLLSSWGMTISNLPTA